MDIPYSQAQAIASTDIWLLSFDTAANDQVKQEHRQTVLIESWYKKHLINNTRLRTDIMGV